MIRKLKNTGNIRKKTLIQIGTFVLVLGALAAVLVFRPFEREQKQLENLKEITESEKGADAVSSQLGNLIDREKSLEGVLSASSGAVAKSPDMSYTGFASDAISLEAQMAENNVFLPRLENVALLAQVAVDVQTFIETLYE